MIKKISNKDKEDWNNFLNNKQETPNKKFIRNKDIGGEKIKTVYDTWIFSKNINSANPNWLLIDTIT